MADEPDAESEELARHRRGLRFRKRDDHAVELFREALAKLADDRARVDRILIELGRFYNPYLNAPIVDLSTRRRVMEALESGDIESARETLDTRLRQYARVDEEDA